MRVGTKSLLFGAHQFILHPICVAVAWKRLYGRWPRDLRVWVAFLVHDWGYWGKPNMDGEEGESHPEVGAAIMARLFGPEWGNFALLHSRHYARKYEFAPSPLAGPDKLGAMILPWWVYVPMATLSGEIDEYMSMCKAREGRPDAFKEYTYGVSPKKVWYACCQRYLQSVAEKLVVGQPVHLW